MLIHPWHEATKDEWQELLTHVDFGQVVAAGRGRDYPVVVPTHFHYDGADHVWLHLARPNPSAPPEHGVPTSYYTAVQRPRSSTSTNRTTRSGCRLRARSTATATDVWRRASVVCG